MGHRLRGDHSWPAWAGGLREGWQWGQPGDMSRWCIRKAQGSTTVSQSHRHPSSGVLLPELSCVGHNGTSENISNRFNSCGFFSASPLLLALCCVLSFLGGSDSSFISWGTKLSHCMAVMLLLVIPLPRLCQESWCPSDAGVSLPPP